MYKLYYSPGACSLAPHVVLHELAVPHEAIKIDLHAGEGQKPEFLKLNPRGQVPLLIDDSGAPVKEGAAIMIYLMEKHKSPLLPQSGIAQAKALEWLCWGNSTLHPAYSRAFWAKYRIQDETVKAFVLKESLAQIQKLWDEAEEQLGRTKYLAGDQVTAADILIAVIANWDVGQAFTMGPNLKRVIREISQRPSFQKAIGHEQVEYKAAA